MYYIYILTKEKKPVYVGITLNYSQRIRTHRYNKKIDFDSYIVLDSYKDKKTALAVERSIYKGIFTFMNDTCMNKVNILFAYDVLKKGLGNFNTSENE